MPPHQFIYKDTTCQRSEQKRTPPYVDTESISSFLMRKQQTGSRYRYTTH